MKAEKSNGREILWTLSGPMLGVELHAVSPTRLSLPSAPQDNAGQTEDALVSPSLY